MEREDVEGLGLTFKYHLAYSFGIAVGAVLSGSLPVLIGAGLGLVISWLIYLFCLWRIRKWEKQERTGMQDS